MTQPCLTLVRRLDALLDELRSAWATGRRVAVSLATGERLEGHVQHVSTTGAFADVGPGRVFAGDLLAVHLPSRLGDSTVRQSSPFHGDGHAINVHPDQLALPVHDSREMYVIGTSDTKKGPTR